MIESGVSPKIAGALPHGGGGTNFWWHHDLSSSHAAHRNKQFSATNNLTTPHWVPSGEDLSPLDIYVNPQRTHRLRGKDLSTGEKLMAEASRALCDMGATRSF